MTKEDAYEQKLADAYAAIEHAMSSLISVALASSDERHAALSAHVRLLRQTQRYIHDIVDLDQKDTPRQKKKSTIPK